MTNTNKIKTIQYSYVSIYMYWHVLMFMLQMRAAVLCLVLLTVIVQYVSAVVQTSDAPLYLAKCYGKFKKRTNLMKTPAASIQSYCDNLFMWHKSKELNVKRGAKSDAM